ncbi:CRP-like cAMP-binding protein [Mucilaginibacter sp. UYP25]|uniref:Crp/Fnr family transcriptional regulator n=1 Tax=unclassified Mucilaginibacter TaxID=2617802 RepID=UPI003396CA29
MNTNTITTSVSLASVNPLADRLAIQTSSALVLKPLIDHNNWMFFKYIQAVTGQALNDDEERIISNNLKIKKLRKRQFFLQAGDACRYLGFIVKGATKMYSINERGQESIITFCMENDIITDMESFLDGKESCYHIEALEDLEMVVFERNQLFQLLVSVPALNLMFCQFQMRQLIDSQKRINASLSMNAEERYMDLLSSRPDYSQRFSQNMLACYLGLKPETLCRIRKR